MANKKVSQLSATTEANDNVWIVMNNSGETETFKIKREDFLSGTTPYTYNSTTSGITETQPTTSTQFNRRGLTNTETAGSYSNFIIGKNNNVGSTGMFMFVFGEDNQSLAGGGLGTKDSIVNIGRANQTNGAATHTAFTFGRGNQSNAPRAITMGEDCRANADSAIAMGVRNYATTYSISLGGSDNQITNSSYSYLYGGNNNKISSTGGRNGIFGGSNNTISGTSEYVVLLGLNNFTSPTENDTTYTQNHASLGQAYQGYFDNGSGSTFTIDWNNGNTQKMSWDASGGTITCSNTQTGAHYRMVINNPSGHAPSSFSVSGKTIKFNGGSFVVYSGESVCELFITDDSVFVNQLGLFS